jgi:hypothetical protein
MIKQPGAGQQQKSKASLSENFMSLFPTHPDFGNNVEKLHPHETLCSHETLIIFLFINMVPHQHN